MKYLRRLIISTALAACGNEAIDHCPVAHHNHRREYECVIVVNGRVYSELTADHDECMTARDALLMEAR